MSETSESVEIITYEDQYRADFERLNRRWIEQYFVVEEADRKVFADPLNYIIDPGGQIFFVRENDEIKGTCAVLRNSESTFELGKMAVDPSAQGKGFGKLLIQTAIEFTKNQGAKELILSSNTKLDAAIKLYEKYGFEALPHISDERYTRVDIMMRLPLGAE
jgi:GNAT superfamily N-acetyltransferase